MASIESQISRRDMANLQRIFRETEKSMSREMSTLIKQGAKAFIRRVTGATPMAPKFVAWVFMIINGIKTAIHLPNIVFGSGQIDKVTPRGRGYAKSGWAKAARELGSKIKHGSGPGGFKNKLKEKNPWFQIENEVPYIISLDRGGPLPDNPAKPIGQNISKPHHFMSKGIKRTIREFERKLTRHARKALKGWK